MPSVYVSKGKDKKKLWTFVWRKRCNRVVCLSECNDEITNHSISASCDLSKEDLDEKRLSLLGGSVILNLPLEDCQRMWVCYRHRQPLGRFWWSSKVACQYPEHTGEKKRVVKGREVVNVKMAQGIQKLLRAIFPIG